MKQHFLVEGKLTLNGVEGSNQNLPTKHQFYKYMVQNEYVTEIVDYITIYHDFYDDVINVSLNYEKLTISFDLIIENGGPNSSSRIEYFETDLLTPEQVLKDLQNSIKSLSESEEETPEEFFYPDEKGAKISVVNFQVIQLN